MSSASSQEGHKGLEGLKRTGSKGNLAGLNGAGVDVRNNMASFQKAASVGSTKNPVSASATPTINTPSQGLLKRSRSMGTFDSFINRDTTGVDAVNAISNQAIVPESNSNNSQAHLHPTETQAATNQTPEDVSDTASKASPSLNVSLDMVASPLDDSQLQHEPMARVDYFSHDWNESDLSSSWRYIVSRRQEMANSARLENASWRTWAKAKYNLKTVSPESLNWLKDYDVTWLYGPLYHEHSSHAGLSGSQTNLHPRTTSENDAAAAAVAVATVAPAADVTPSTTAASCANTRVGPKSILKKKTLAQIMLEETPGYTPGHSGSETTNYLRHHIYRQVPTGQNRERMAALLNRQYEQSRTVSGSTEGALDSDYPGSGSIPQTNYSDNNSPSTVIRPASYRTASQASAASIASLGSTTSQSSTRRVHFNDRVEQCIALDIDESTPCSPEKSEPPRASASHSRDRIKNILGGKQDSDDGDESNSDADDEEDDDDEGGLFLGMRRHDVQQEVGHTIIAPLPATTLKYEDTDEEVEPVVLQPAAQRGVRAGFSANYDYSSVYKIVDPRVKAVPMASKPAAGAARKVKPVASFGLNEEGN